MPRARPRRLRRHPPLDQRRPPLPGAAPLGPPPRDQRRSDLRVAAPLVLALRDQRHLVAAPRGQGEAAAVVAPRRRIEAAQAGVAAALDEAGLVAAVRVRQARGEADAADFALGVAVD